ncbi:GspE/PulE/PilB domain-containing protein [Desulfomicrobium salsuginis]
MPTDTPRTRHIPEPFAGLAAGRLDTRSMSALMEQTDCGRDLGDALLEAGVPASDILEALARHHGLASVSYDERLCVPPELVREIDHALLADGRWFPCAVTDGGAVVVASCAPGDPCTAKEVAEHFPGKEIQWRVALRRDIRWFVEDLLRRSSGKQIGAERTMLAFWRNTMAHWRTKMACYRTDMARARTSLNIMRWGLGLVALSNALMRTPGAHAPQFVLWATLAAGLAVAGASFWSYFQVRRPESSLPPLQTLVETTAATIQFLETFHDIEEKPAVPFTPFEPDKPTMLGRLGDFLTLHSTILDTKSGFRERIHLARERNVLAAQRTVCGCYRTVAARARTGLSLLRTGVSVSCLGIGLLRYFDIGPLTFFDAILIISGLLMICDGTAWYWPVRFEQAGTPRCIEWGGDED